MSASIPVTPKKRGRPPAGGRDPITPVRMPDTLRSALDGYIGQQPDPKPSRSEMIRKILEDRLVHEGLIEAGPGVGTKT